MKKLRAFTVSSMGLLLTAALLPLTAAAEATTQSTLLDRIQVEDMMIEYYWAFSTDEGHDIEKFWAPDGEFVKIDGQWKIKRRELGTYAYVPRQALAAGGQ